MVESLGSIVMRHPFFEGLEKPYLELLTGCASNARYNRGEYLFREEEEATQFYIIRHGKVAIEAAMPGSGLVTIQTYEADDVVGWSWLFPPHRWHFTGRSSNHTRLISLDGECLRGKCEADHNLGYEFLKRFSHVMVQRLEATRLQLLDVYNK